MLEGTLVFFWNQYSNIVCERLSATTLPYLTLPYLTLPYRSVVSCARLTTSPCHILLSSAALFSWSYFIPLVVVTSVVQVFLGRPRDLLPSSCLQLVVCVIIDVLCLIRCPRYCSFLVLNCLTISLPVPILPNTSSLVIFSGHDNFKTLR